MNLKFRVIWVEDNHSAAEQEQIAQGIRQAGFEPEFVVDIDGSRIEELARHQAIYADYDFLLLDLNLANGVKGDELASEIRRRFRSTPMLFYSREPVDDLRQRMLRRSVEGVFCAGRDQMPTRVVEMVQDLASSANRLAGMRGLAARVVADCDAELRGIIRLTQEQGHQIDGRSLCDHLDEVVEQSAEYAAGLYRGCPAGDLEARLGSFAVTSMHLYKVVARIVRDRRNAVAGLPARRSRLTNYEREVLSPRNTFSHAIEDEGPDGWRIETRGPEGLTVADFPRLRRDFLEHLENLRAIQRLLAAEQA